LDKSKGEESPVYVDRCLEYSVPVILKNHIDGIFNTVQVPPKLYSHVKRQEKATSKISESQSFFRVSKSNKKLSNQGVTVSFLNDLYEISSNIGNAKFNQSVFSTGGNYFSQNDLSEFQTGNGFSQQQAIVIGGHETDDCSLSATGNQCDEGNLDTQYISGVAQVTGTIFWYSGAADSYLDWILAVANDSNPPNVNSISYGSIEQEMSPLAMSRFNDEASILSAQGVTIAVSSGDDGVSNFECYCNEDSSSSKSDWQGTGVWSGRGYFPSFPATSPYVLAVGATMGEGGTVSTTSEEVTCQSDGGGIITSGGGFSTFFERPSWQNNDVDKYFRILSPTQQPGPGYNPNGRG
jgi:tripeptidyl-peptidase-1